MHQTGSVFPGEKLAWAGGIVLLVLVGTVFWPVVGFDFVRWDDDISVTQNHIVTAPWSWALLDSEQALRFKPLHWLCFRLLYAGFGFNPAAWHAFNLALHVATALLFYHVLRRIFSRCAVTDSVSHATWAAGVGAAAWALHPLRAEVVGWVTASHYSLTALMLLASFACYLEAYFRPERTWRWLGLAWLFAVMAYASYPVGATYGLWLMTVDRWLLPAAPGKRKAWIADLNLAWCVKQACFLAPAVLTAGLTVWGRYMSPGIFAPAPDLASLGLATRVALALAKLSYFGWCLIWPVDLTPNMLPMVMDQATVGRVVILALVTVVALGLAWAARRRRPRMALVAFGFVALALPCLGWTEWPVWPGDRYSYIVDFVLIGGLAGGILHWAAARPARGKIVAMVLLALVLAGAGAVRRQTMIWRDSPALFAHMEQHPNFAELPRQQVQIYLRWGNHQLEHQRPELAVDLFNRAQRVYLSAIRAAVGAANYREALALSMNLEQHFEVTPVMRRERGAWLIRLSRGTEALAELHLALQAMPDDPRVRELLAEAEQLDRKADARD